VTKVAFAGVAAAAVAGTVAYGAVSTVGHRESSSVNFASGETDTAAPVRTTSGRASRSLGYCGRTGPGQARVENYLQTQTARFGQVIVDAQQDAVDCLAIKKFQTWLQLPTATGFADEQTAELADRLAKSSPAACHADASTTTVCVDLTDQTLWVMRDGSVVFTPTVVRSGAPAGDFTISEKKQVKVLSQAGAPLPYWEGFATDAGIYSTSTPLYGTAETGLTGDVNLLGRDAQSLYGLTRVGTPVHVFGQAPDA
jgi:hypothetical protein